MKLFPPLCFLQVITERRDTAKEVLIAFVLFGSPVKIPLRVRKSFSLAADC